MPAAMVDQLIRIFAFDVDFQGRANFGDSMEVFHSLPDPNDRDANEPEILFAALNIGGVAKRFYRWFCWGGSGQVANSVNTQGGLYALLKSITVIPSGPGMST